MRASTSPARAEKRGDGPSLDPFTAERVLRGTASAKDIPVAYRRVMAELRAASAPVRAADLTGEAAVVAAYRSAHAERRVKRSRRRRTRALTISVAAAAVVAVGGTAGAATGNLPPPAQQRLSGALAHVGITVPSGGDTDPAPDRAETTESPAADPPAPVEAEPAPASELPPAPSTPRSNGGAEEADGHPTGGPPGPGAADPSTKHPHGAPPGQTTAETPAPSHPHGGPPGQDKPKGASKPGK